MKKLNELSDERFQTLLMKAIDNELDPSEKEMFDKLISSNTSYNKEWQDLSQLKKVTSKLHFKEPAQEEWDMYWSNVYNRIERGLAWLLFTSGAVILFGYGAFKFVESFIPDPNIPLIIKVGIFLLFSGFLALGFSIIREKLFLHKSDPYKELKR
ncbi:MAG: hypothetical protein D8M58_04690 [Calditrichaeota bacterium]|nr:MAG: hypothetical protein DWQ03_02385 [Calditrichota bacterium]MBL1204669.1 hypothetical protein [Calditrichota bacterium]NOG44497.1 hypothetical protein [Calditrichota bacterium]